MSRDQFLRQKMKTFRNATGWFCQPTGHVWRNIGRCELLQHTSQLIHQTLRLHDENHLLTGLYSNRSLYIQPTSAISQSTQTSFNWLTILNGEFVQLSDSDCRIKKIGESSFVQRTLNWWTFKLVDLIGISADWRSYNRPSIVSIT